MCLQQSLTYLCYVEIVRLHLLVVDPEDTCFAHFRNIYISIVLENVRYFLSTGGAFSMDLESPIVLVDSGLPLLFRQLRLVWFLLGTSMLQWEVPRHLNLTHYFVSEVLQAIVFNRLVLDNTEVPLLLLLVVLR